MTAFDYIHTDLIKLGWFRLNQKQYIYYHPNSEFYLEILATGRMDVLDADFSPVGVIKQGDYSFINNLF